MGAHHLEYRSLAAIQIQETQCDAWVWRAPLRNLFVAGRIAHPTVGKKL